MPLRSQMISRISRELRQRTKDQKHLITQDYYEEYVCYVIRV